MSVYLAEIATPGRVKAFTPAGSPAASRWLSWWRQPWLLRSMRRWKKAPFANGAGARLPVWLPDRSFIFFLRRKLKRRRNLPLAVTTWRCATFKTLLKNPAGGDRRHADGRHDHHRVLPHHRPCADLRQKVLLLSASDSLLVTLLVAISNFIWLPIGGALSDRFGRKPVLVAMTLLTLATAYPALSLFAAAPSFSMMLAVLLWLSFIYGLYNGAMIPALTEIMPTEVRWLVLVGLQPGDGGVRRLYAGSLHRVDRIHRRQGFTGLLMSFAALCALLATLYMYRRIAMPLQTAH